MAIFACEPDFLRNYLYKRNTISAEELKPYSDLLAKKIGEPSNGRNSNLTFNGTSEAIIEINGVLRNGPSTLDDFFGFSYTTYGTILEAIDRIKFDENINKVTLLINSPGGYVAPGLDQVWSAVKELRADKDVTAINNGMMASGAYWIASAAEHIYSINELTQQGSIGAYSAVIDFSEMDKRIGIKEIRIVSKNAPLKNLPTDDPKLVDQIQEDLDYIEKLFLARISEGRGISVKKITDEFGQGGLVTTDKALSAGMIDEILSNESQSTIDNSIEVVEQTDKEKGLSHMSLKDLMASDASVNAEVEEIRKTAYDEGLAAGKSEVEKRVAFASKYLSNEAYNDHIHKLARGVMAGEINIDTLKQVVDFFDQDSVKAEIEKAKIESAKVETPVESEPDIVGSTFEQDGKIRTAEDLEKARKARMQ